MSYGYGTGAGYGQPAPGGYPGAPPQQMPGGYPPPMGGGYGAPPGVDPQVLAWFQAVDTDRSGFISANELRQALTNANYSHFNDEACRLMINMFDRDGNGTISVNEFQELWTYINQWKDTFVRIDTNRSGSIETNELSSAFNMLGFRVSPQFCNLVVSRYDYQGRRSLTLDLFIQACVLMKMLTDSFRQRDTNMNGSIQISYEDFMCMAMWNKP